ncbi:hypothetical protein [[Muricauda] lutisoli]|nr:hypothetical protein [[Muricauda] lutisoli]
MKKTKKYHNILTWSFFYDELAIGQILPKSTASSIMALINPFLL